MEFSAKENWIFGNKRVSLNLFQPNKVI